MREVRVPRTASSPPSRIVPATDRDEQLVGDVDDGSPGQMVNLERAAITSLAVHDEHALESVAFEDSRSLLTPGATTAAFPARRRRMAGAAPRLGVRRATADRTGACRRHGSKQPQLINWPPQRGQQSTSQPSWCSWPPATPQS